MTESTIATYCGTYPARGHSGCPSSVECAHASLDDLDTLDALMVEACMRERVDVCACCGNLAAGHGHFALYCPPCAERPLHGCDHGRAA